MSITINGQTSPAAEFAWDGCHKIYLLDNGDADKNGKYGYMLSKNGEAGYKVLPVSELQRVWDQSCPLRFINNWALDKNMFPNATRSPSPSKRVERENHEIIQGIRGRIRSGYRSHPMGVQPPFCRVEKRSRRKIVPGNRQYTKSHHDRSKPGTRSRQGLTCRYSRA